MLTWAYKTTHDVFDNLPEYAAEESPRPMRIRGAFSGIRRIDASVWLDGYLYPCVYVYSYSPTMHAHSATEQRGKLPDACWRP